MNSHGINLKILKYYLAKAQRSPTFPAKTRGIHNVNDLKATGYISLKLDILRYFVGKVTKMFCFNLIVRENKHIKVTKTNKCHSVNKKMCTFVIMSFIFRHAGNLVHYFRV